MKNILNKGDTIALIACSNGLSPNMNNTILNLEKTLRTLSLNIIRGNSLFKENNIYCEPAKKRAESLMKCFISPNIKAIFDVSGGDLCNEILPFLDFELIASNPKPFFGYSDLSVIINSIYSNCNIPTYLYQIRNLIGENSSNQILNFTNSLFKGTSDLFTFSYKWIQGNSMEGILIGGNMRCTLKLSGTKFMPDFNNKILLLESLGGDVAKVRTAFTQYKLIGAFDNINGIILGNFSEMENNKYTPTVENILIDILDNPNIPVIKTNSIGHNSDSKAAIIGKWISF